MMDVIEASNLSGLSFCRHAFFTRQGGVSQGVHATLNCALGSQDEIEKVLENRARVAAFFGQGPEKLLTCQQIHSVHTVKVSSPWDDKHRPEADAMVTDRRGVILGILTADCAPILFADQDGHVIGAAHAGWRGAFSGIIESTVATMEKLGARRARIKAAIGPCIWPESYEVGPEFPIPFLEQDGLNVRFFRRSDKRAHYLFDLPGYIVAQLKKAGIQDVALSPADTCADEARFYSYRRGWLRGERDMGRLISAIMIKG